MYILYSLLTAQASTVKLLYFFNVHFCDHTHQVKHSAKCSRLKETVVQKCIWKFCKADMKLENNNNNNLMLNAQKTKYVWPPKIEVK